MYDYARAEVEKICQECGKPYIGHPQSKYCEPCRPVVHSRQRLEAQKKRNAEIKAAKPKLKPKPKKSNMQTIIEIAKAAKAAGMSYGEFSTKYHL